MEHAVHTKHVSERVVDAIDAARAELFERYHARWEAHRIARWEAAAARIVPCWEVRDA